MSSTLRYSFLNPASPPPSTNSSRTGGRSTLVLSNQMFLTPSICGSGDLSRSSGDRMSKMRFTLDESQARACGSVAASSSVPQRYARPERMAEPGTAPSSRALMSEVDGMKGGEVRAGTSSSGGMGLRTSVSERLASWSFVRVMMASVASSMEQRRLQLTRLVSLSSSQCILRLIPGYNGPCYCKQELCLPPHACVDQPELRACLGTLWKQVHSIVLVGIGFWKKKATSPKLPFSCCQGATPFGRGMHDCLISVIRPSPKLPRSIWGN